MDNELKGFIAALRLLLDTLKKDEDYRYDPGWQEAITYVNQFIWAYEHGKSVIHEDDDKKQLGED